MRELSRRNRRRLIPALVVMAALALLCVAGIGQALHARSETIDSLEYWRGQEDSAASTATGSFDSPARRVRRLEAELEAVPERLFPLGVVLVLAAGLLFLGVRALRYREPGAAA